LTKTLFWYKNRLQLVIYTHSRRIFYASEEKSEKESQMRKQDKRRQKMQANGIAAIEKLPSAQKETLAFRVGRLKRSTALFYYHAPHSAIYRLPQFVNKI